MEFENERILTGFLFAVFEKLLLRDRDAALLIAGSGAKAGLRVMGLDTSPSATELTRMIEEGLKFLDPSALDQLD